MEKKLYPVKFIPIPSKRVWGGDSLIKALGKNFVEVDSDGNEVALTTADRIGESWEIADMGEQDSVISEGWLAGNTISEFMETYLDRIVGENVYEYFGRQFPLLIKFLDIREKLSVQVHPDDEVAIERYDSLGKAEIWYVMDAAPDAKVYMGFKRETSAQELYDRCQNGTVDEILNVIHPKKGDSIFIAPGTVHAAEGGILIAEIQESSDMTFRLYDWGREFNPATARTMHLAEAIDVIDYGKWDESNWKHPDGTAIQELVKRPEFSVNKMLLKEALKVSTEKYGSFIIYICPEGEASVQVPVKGGMENYILKEGETILIPEEVQDFYLVPRDKDTILLEAMVEKREERDDYINPDTEPYLEGEDYESKEE